ncbi:OsmC/Ohr family [Phlebopus sp. FC_14]|nr:OsmC/Ohr family [Phlebopus sp. FC_14]
MFAPTSRALLQASRRASASQTRLYATDSMGRTVVTLKNHKVSLRIILLLQELQAKAATAKSTQTRRPLSPSDWPWLGGKGDGQNPEQLFAMGYASCFLGALQMMAGKLGKKDAARNAVIHASVHLGEPEQMGGYGLAVDIKVEGVEDEELIKAGHEACPYSRALLHGVVVNVSKA